MIGINVEKEATPRLRTVPTAADAPEPHEPGDAPVPLHELAARAVLTAPPIPPWYSPRPRLLEKLDKGSQLPLVLVSASAGTGKTALVAEWLTTRTDTERTGWVTLEAPNGRLWGLVLACLQRLGVDVPEPRLEPGADDLDLASLTSLAATLAWQPYPLTVVIDGFEAAPAHTAEDLDFLLRGAAGGLRLVIVSRSDPTFRLYRHRLDGTVLEIRDRDLAFRDAEARALLERAGVTLKDESVHDLNVKVRGWTTGLRFAARALADTNDPDKGVAEVLDTTADITEYLLGEVLDAQTPELRELLLRTSVPDTIYPGLADEIAGAGRMIPGLTKLNTFLEPVNGAPGCYRYFPLFRDLLRAELAYEAPDLFADLQERTSAWLLSHGLLDAGVRHLAAAGHWETAAGAVIDHLAIERLLVCNDDDPLVSTLSSMPDRAPGPSSSLVRAALACGKGRPGRSATFLVAARDAAAAPDCSPRFTATFALVDAVRARDCDDPEAAEAAASKALMLLESLGAPTVEVHPELLVLARTCRGVAQFRRGRLAEASQTLVSSAATAPVDSPERPQALGYLALVEAVEGRLSEAADNAARAVGEAADRPVGGALRSSAGEVALAVVSLERMDLDAAHSHLQTAAAAEDTNPVCRGLAVIAEAGVQQSMGRVGRALTLVAEARAALSERDQWLDRRLALETARLQVASGATKRALLALAPVEREPEAAVLAAQVHLREGHDRAAVASLAEVRDSDVPLHAQVTSILVDAAHEARRSPARSRGLLDKSLRLAEPERMRRPFEQAPPGIHRMLSQDPHLASLSKWLTAGTGTSASRLPSGPALPGSSGPRVVPLPPALAPDELPAVVEPLTSKELEVLSHLAELLSTQEIAATMYISVNTVRTHVRNILRKLGVTRRSMAVRRARLLHIV